MGVTIPKLFMAGGAVGFTYYLVMRQHWFPNPYKTQGVSNIEQRWTAGGGTPTHTPGAATELGSQSIEARQEGGHKGIGTQRFADDHSNQKDTEGLLPRKFKEAQYNDPRGK
ncbi:hypothetical protein BDV95DRAFT_602393 [Massariosphaeria phaeospora]|uniref:Uncharacterized protein n=1 Tax=Massariosphaeria phaeospora TaxID=100035 RepID=A0A7C8IFD3_9PLEO|nr:hypothetical protein BDV95DRAFT_602393 [Massariosphaeria phaeospora]